VYTLATKSFDDLEIVVPRPKSGLGDNFSLGSSKFRILDIQNRYSDFRCLETGVIRRM
jgi:hypothetical protein